MAEPFIGEICIFGFNFAPIDWALCNGQVMPIMQNQALYSLLGITYGGDGKTTFGIPDLRGRMPIGMGNGTGLTPRPIGTKAGQEAVTLNATQAPLPAHTHTATSNSTSVNIAIPAVSGTNATTGAPATSTTLGQGNVDLSSVGGGIDPANIYSSAAANTTLKPFAAPVPAGTVTVNANTATPATSPVPLMNPFLALNFCIALVGLYPSRP